MAVDLVTPFTKVELEPLATENQHGLGVFWGAFNPVHVAHLTIADQVRQQLHLDEVRFIPENPTPQTLEMLRLAIAGKKGLSVSGCRLDDKSAIADNMKKLKEENPKRDIYFIIGGDLVASLERWPKIEQLLETVTLVGVQRPRYRAGTSFPLLWVDVPLMDVSSAAIREEIKKGLTPNFLLPAEVLSYIKEEGLYV